MYRIIELDELRINADGYVYFCDKNHPLAYTNNLVLFHRHVASIKVGRWLTTFEHVHHIDGEKKNNDPANLEVVSLEEHSNLHAKSLALKNCPVCKNEFKPKVSIQKYCSNNCRILSNVRLDSLQKEELEYLIWTVPYTKLAAQFNCSDNGIKKWAKRLGCLLPPSRFHVKYLEIEEKLAQYNKFKLVGSTHTPDLAAYQ